MPQVRAGFYDRPAELAINLKIAKALGLAIPIATPAGRSGDSVSEQRPFLDRFLRIADAIVVQVAIDERANRARLGQRSP